MSKLPSTRQSRSKKKRQLSCIVKPSVIAKIYILSSKNFLKKNSPKRFVIRQSRKCRLPSKEFGRERGKGLDTETSALRSLWHSLSFNVCKRADDRGAREARNLRGGRGVRARRKRRRGREDREFKYRRH